MKVIKHCISCISCSLLTYKAQRSKPAFTKSKSRRQEDNHLKVRVSVSLSVLSCLVLSVWQVWLSAVWSCSLALPLPLSGSLPLCLPVWLSAVKSCSLAFPLPLSGSLPYSLRLPVCSALVSLSLSLSSLFSSTFCSATLDPDWTNRSSLLQSTDDILNVGAQAGCPSAQVRGRPGPLSPGGDDLSKERPGPWRRGRPRRRGRPAWGRSARQGKPPRCRRRAGRDGASSPGPSPDVVLLCYCFCVERKKERKKERKTDRQTDRQTHAQN